jgi:hypothetical protein
MDLSIVDFLGPSSEEWDHIWSICPYSTYFQSREWAEIWADFSKNKITQRPLLLMFSDGSKALLPFSYEKRFFGLVHRYSSSPAGTFGGWISDSRLDKAHQSILMNFIASNYKNIEWRFNPYEKVLIYPKRSTIIKDETDSICLSVDFKTIFHQWSKGHSSAARQAQKSGVTIQIAHSSDDWVNYFKIYENSIERWGRKATSAYSSKLFEILSQRKSPNIKLWLAKYNNLVIAGALCFYSPTHVVYWHGAALSQYFHLRPVHLLMYEAIRNAVEGSYVWFDFNPSSNLAGVKSFKRGFGSMPIECDILSISSREQKILMNCLKLLSNIKNKFL